MPRLRIAHAALICTIAAAGSAATAAAALTKADRISHSGLGPIKLGMTEPQIERATKRQIKLSTPAAGSTCATATIAGKTSGLFTGKRLRRIYVRTTKFATTKGVRVGSSEKRVLAAYSGKVVRVPQKYVPNEDDLVVRQGSRKLIFRLAKGKVAEISTGLKPEIDLVEACS